MKMSGSPSLLQLFRGASTAGDMPDRMRAEIARFEARSERLIGWVQLGIGSFLSLLYLVAPRPSDGLASRPVPIILGIYLAFTLVRLGLSHRGRMPLWFLGLSVVVDVGLLYALIWYFHIQYGQDPGFSLKAPTVMYVFVFIAVRALRFRPGWVLATGLAAAAGWIAMTFYAVETAGMELITRSFVAYIQGDRILIGAEIDKVVAILVVTSVLALALLRGERLLARATREQIERAEIRRFLPADVELAITATHVAAGDAEERQAAIIVLDIRGFSIFARSQEPRRVVGVLVGLHALIVPIIERHGGIVDKYLGDGLLATFGAARPLPDPAAAALRAMVEILGIAGDWSERMRATTGHRLRVNGALTAGTVVFAALGDERRLEYTVIGDAVNLAAKLEKYNKVAGTQAVTTREAFDLAGRQGFDAASVAAGDRPACRIPGIDQPIDLVVLSA